jgi:transcriptional regulator with XRE-family HTH domain
MAEVNGARLKELMEQRRTTRSRVADAIGVTQPTISRLIDGTTKEFGKLLELAAHLETTPEYLVSWTDDPALPADVGERAVIRTAALARSPGTPVDTDADLPGMVRVKELDLSLGLGGQFLEGPYDFREISFPGDWLRQFSSAPPDLLHFVRGKGDSMYPTIMDGDVCMLDTGRRRLDEQDALWAVSFGDLGMIKRLRRMPDGSVKIMSDNKEVSDELATDGELYVWGRCVGVFRKV